jgi:hypothetical protein
MGVFGRGLRHLLGLECRAWAFLAVDDEAEHFGPRLVAHRVALSTRLTGAVGSNSV